MNADNNWLEKNNQDAKGEGTSSLSAVVGTTTRASRNSKTKGKEPEILQPLHMTEDEFELILGLFERITDDRCPCLHVVCNFQCSCLTFSLTYSRTPRKSLPSRSTSKFLPTNCLCHISLPTSFLPSFLRHPELFRWRALFTHTGANDVWSAEAIE